MSDRERNTAGEGGEGRDGGGRKGHGSDIYRQVIWHEALSLLTHRGKGCYMVQILYCSGDWEMRGGNRSSKEEENEINHLFDTSDRAFVQLHEGLCHRAGYTVRSDCW